MQAPFFVDKLKIQMLPCIVMFQGGKAFDRIVGFDELGYPQPSSLLLSACFE